MDDKLATIRDLFFEIDTIHSCSPSSFVALSAIQNLIDDIIHKLRSVRKLMNEATSQSQLSSPNFVYGNGSQISPYYSKITLIPQTSKRLITEVILNAEGNENPTDLARKAYSDENYAKCIRIIEKFIAEGDQKIDCEILNLCHNSYKKIVDELSTEKEQIKLCEWWRLFLDNVILSEISNSTMLHLHDCRIQCLEKRKKLDLVPLYIEEGLEFIRYALNDAKLDALKYSEKIYDSTYYENNTNNNQPCFHCKPGDNTNGSSEMDELVRHEANDHENQLNEIVKSTKFRQQRNCIITRF
ncbi:unnamed protein product [Dracunculus medinensis]|uniref:Uncharacterized protein n=1 Tax=Dracunculus medinensis TaxID=318479 RepID=A0A0N4UN20_DRAME|nr:unnamed protein product [Dracunculus medinensis]